MAVKASGSLRIWRCGSCRWRHRKAMVAMRPIVHIIAILRYALPIGSNCILAAAMVVVESLMDEYVPSHGDCTRTSQKMTAA